MLDELDDLTPEQQRTEWIDLVDWVIWLHNRYELAAEERLPACWPHHPGLVEELRALKAWRHDIYQPATGLTEIKPDSSASATTPTAANGQAARYWHADLRQLLHAATTIYAAGCRAGHRTATGLGDSTSRIRAAWLSALAQNGAVSHDTLPAVHALSPGRTGLTLAMTTTPPPPSVQTTASRARALHPADIYDAMARGTAHPLSELNTDYVRYRGAWWTPTPWHAGTDETDRDDPERNSQGQPQAAYWYRVEEPALIIELDRAAIQLAAADTSAGPRQTRVAATPHPGGA